MMDRRKVRVDVLSVQDMDDVSISEVRDLLDRAESLAPGRELFVSCTTDYDINSFFSISYMRDEIDDEISEREAKEDKERRVRFWKRRSRIKEDREMYDRIAGKKHDWSKVPLDY